MFNALFCKTQDNELEIQISLKIPSSFFCVDQAFYWIIASKTDRQQWRIKRFLVSQMALLKLMNSSRHQVDTCGLDNSHTGRTEALRLFILPQSAAHIFQRMKLITGNAV